MPPSLKKRLARPFGHCRGGGLQNLQIALLWYNRAPLPSYGLKSIISIFCVPNKFSRYGVGGGLLYKAPCFSYDTCVIKGGRGLKRRDFWVLGGVLALALILLLAGGLVRPAPARPAKATLSFNEASGFDAGSAVPADAESYLRIKQGSEYYPLVPLNGPGEIVIRQRDNWENVIHFGRNSALMHSANCPNHDCVRQGEVTLDNYETRVFLSFITCLPHQLSLELLPRDQALRWLEGSGQ